jgi:hypothetical protein
VRPLVLLSAPLLAGCLIQNPGFDADQTTGGESTTSDALTGTAATTSSDTSTTDGGGSGGGSGSTTTGEPATTGCIAELLFPDSDNDGFGAGAGVLACPGEPGLAGADGDCDDANPAINPDASELCNQLDDDCDGLEDEFSATNADCADCNLSAYGGHSYWLCRKTAEWDAARSFCQTFGPVDLTIVDDLAENDFLFAGNGLPDSPMWVGGRDSDPNMPVYYTWYDGSPLTFNNFALADLDDGCIAMPNGDGGQWRDRDCGEDYSFACESKG